MPVILDEQNRALALFCVKYAISTRELLHNSLGEKTEAELKNWYEMQAALWKLYDLLKGEQRCTL